MAKKLLKLTKEHQPPRHKPHAGEKMGGGEFINRSTIVKLLKNQRQREKSENQREKKNYHKGVIISTADFPRSKQISNEDVKIPSKRSKKDCYILQNKDIPRQLKIERICNQPSCTKRNTEFFSQKETDLRKKS